VIHIRPAVAADAPALADIYTHHILNGTGTFEEEPVDAAEMIRRLARIQGKGWPWLVAEDATGLLGFAYAGQFRDRAAYRFSAENSIYVRPDAMGRGVGDRLLGALLDASAAAGFQRMFAVIGDSANLGSIRLHEKHGFTHAGQCDSAGFKFGRYLDIVFMQRVI
jgi:phosphinothricin acetyltransferase